MITYNSLKPAATTTSSLYDHRFVKNYYLAPNVVPSDYFMLEFYWKILFIDHLGKLSNAMYKKLNTVFYLKHLRHDSVINCYNMFTLHFKIEAIFPIIRFRWTCRQLLLLLMERWLWWLKITLKKTTELICKQIITKGMYFSILVCQITEIRHNWNNTHTAEEIILYTVPS